MRVICTIVFVHGPGGIYIHWAKIGYKYVEALKLEKGRVPPSRF